MALETDNRSLHHRRAAISSMAGSLVVALGWTRSAFAEDGGSGGTGSGGGGGSGGAGGAAGGSSGGTGSAGGSGGQATATSGGGRRKKKRHGRNRH